MTGVLPTRGDKKVAVDRNDSYAVPICQLSGFGKCPGLRVEGADIADGCFPLWGSTNIDVVFGSVASDAEPQAKNASEKGIDFHCVGISCQRIGRLLLAWLLYGEVSLNERSQLLIDKHSAPDHELTYLATKCPPVEFGLVVVPLHQFCGTNYQRRAMF